MTATLTEVDKDGPPTAPARTARRPWQGRRLAPYLFVLPAIALFATFKL